ncbi:MAG TPA: lipid-binding SYLF domain-containing protein [Steroidobacteraceae bacterium]|nr:lipid-binding SYLF domain-containing protein [Steroidobacteraceae bacterium]
MHMRTAFVTLLAAFPLTIAATAAHAQAREQGRLLYAGEVLQELRTTRDQAIPDRLLERAYGIAVFPDLTKVAFFAGGRRGHGVLVVRDKNGRFTNPVFVTMTGGSFGWQWGVQLTDIVLVFTTPKGVEGINGGKVTLGADAAVAAGPVGRDASAATDAGFKAEVYSYSRNKGVFAGLALDGSVITMDDHANAAFYQKPGVTAGDIIAGNVTTNEDSAQRFLSAVHASTGSSMAQRTASVAGPAGAAGSTAGIPSAITPAPAATPSGSSGAQTFPLPDPKPGQEPK